MGAVAPHSDPMMIRAVAPPASITGRSAAATCSNAGSISSRPSGSASQVWMPDSAGPPGRSSAGERSEWTMPVPAVIRFTAPGSITISVPSESRWPIAPSNR